ncbi:MAG: hemolysin family protein [Opitutales bacterium]
MKEFLAEYGLGCFGIAGILFLNALLVAAEIALVRVRYSHFNPGLLEYLETDRSLQRLMGRADAVVQTVRFGSAFSLLLYGVLVVGLFFGWSGAPPLRGSVDGLYLVGALLVGVAVFYVLADLVPRAIGTQHPIATLRFAYWPIMVLAQAVHPVLWLLRRIARLVLIPFRVEDAKPLAPLEIEAQLELIGERADALPMAVLKILRNAMHLRELVVSDVLLPRNQVQIFDLSQSNADNLRLAREAGHTRFPLCEGDLDRCVGLIHVKDLFRSGVPPERLDLRRMKREMIQVDGELPLEQALTLLLAHNTHMALVTDEFRGVEGVLTLEKILEQLVGDIRDEFDADESVLIRHTPASGDRHLIVDGMTPLHDLEERFDLDLSNDEVSTVSGLITLEMGRIPEAGEAIEAGGLHFEVLQVDETRVLEAAVQRSSASGPPETGESEPDLGEGASDAEHRE